MYCLKLLAYLGFFIHSKNPHFGVPEKCLSYIYLNVLSSLPSRANFEGDIIVISEKDILFISVDLLRGDIYKNTVNVYTPKIFSISAPSGEDRNCRAP